MKKELKLKIMIYFTIFYLSFFTILSALDKNYEFLYYTFIMSFIVFVLILYYKKFNLSLNVMFGLTIVGVLHILGGNIFLDGVRLYDMWFINGVFRYDNFVHMIGSFVAVFVVYSLLYPNLGKNLKYNRILLSVIIVFMVLGIGAFYEIIELVAVVFFNAAEKVGDYLNNALDLVFNLIGCIIACFYLMDYHKKN